MSNDDILRTVTSDTTEEEYERLFSRRQHLIISTGDISDVDGFLALAEYARTGSSCLFIMNYPAFLDPSISESHPETKNADGLGFTYGCHTVMPNKHSSLAFYTWI